MANNQDTIQCNNCTQLKQDNEQLKDMVRQILNNSKGRYGGLGFQNTYKLIYTEDVYNDIRRAINK